MALNSLSFLVILSLLVATSSAAFGSRKALAPGPDAAPPIPDDFGFTPLDSKDPKVVDLARFAIDEHNKESNGVLVLNAVLEAISTSTATATANEGGSNFQLVVLATNGNDLNTYFSNILVAQNDVKKLTSFKQGQDGKINEFLV